MKWKRWDVKILDKDEQEFIKKKKKKVHYACVTSLCSHQGHDGKSPVSGWAGVDAADLQPLHQAGGVSSVHFWLTECVCFMLASHTSTSARTSDSPVHLPPSPFFSLHTATPWWSPLPGLRPNIQHLITNTSLMRGRMEGRREREKEREGERERGSARIQQGIAPQLNRLSNKALSLRGAAY